MSMLMRFATSMMNNASEGMEAEHAAKIKAQEAAKAEEKLIMTELWKNELGVFNQNRKTMMSNPNNYVNADGVTLKNAYPEFFAEGYFNPENMKTFEQVRGMNALFELFAPIPEADEKTVKGHTELLKKIANRSDSEAKYRKMLEGGPDKHSVPTFWRQYSQTDEWKKLLGEAGDSQEGYMKAFHMYNSFKKVKDEDKGEDNEDVFQLFKNIPDLSTTYTFSRKKLNATAPSLLGSLTDLNNLITTQGDNLSKDINAQPEAVQRQMVTELASEIKAMGTEFSEKYRQNVPPGWGGGDKIQKYLDRIPDLTDNTLSAVFAWAEKNKNPLISKVIPDVIEGVDQRIKTNIVELIANVKSGSVIAATKDNSSGSKSFITGMNFETEEAANQWHETVGAPLATSLGYSTFQKLYTENPHVTVESVELANTLWNMNNENGVSIFASSNSNYSTMFQEGFGFTNLDKKYKEQLGYFLGSLENTTHTSTQIASALGLLTSTGNRKSGSTTNSIDGPQKKTGEALEKGLENILDALNWSTPTTETYKNIQALKEKSVLDAAKMAVTLVTDSINTGNEIIESTNKYIEAVINIKGDKTGFASWVTKTASGLFSSSGQLDQLFDGDTIFGVDKATFMADLADETELRNVDGSLAHKSTMDYIENYVQTQIDNNEGLKAVYIGQAAALRMYIAYKMAKFFDPSGRISDKDLKNQLDAFFGDSAITSDAAMIGGLQGAVALVTEEMKLLEMLEYDGDLVLRDGQPNMQYLNKVNGVKSYKLLLRDAGYKRASFYKDQYTPNQKRDVIQRTDKQDRDGNTIFQIFDRNAKLGEGKYRPRMMEAPLNGLFYSSTSNNGWGGTWKFVPSASFSSDDSSSESSEVDSSWEISKEHPGWFKRKNKKGNLEWAQDINGKIENRGTNPYNV